MCHNGDRCLCDCFNLGTNRRAALQLDSLTSALLHQSACIHNGIINGGLVAHKGHIADHECIFCTSGNSGGVVNHILHGNGDGILIAEHNHAQRVANQNGIYATFIHQLCCGIIISGQHSDFVSVQFLLLQGSYCVFHCSNSFSKCL